MNQRHEVRLGEIIKAPAQRDAIHVAVTPVVAGDYLAPGSHVTIIDGMAHHSAREHAVGIVDPFLSIRLEPGETFWLLLYPGSITSLRHEWEHPAFAPEPVLTDDGHLMAKAVLEEFADSHDYDTVDDLVRDLYDLSTEGKINWEPCGWRSREVPASLWPAYERYTGRKCERKPEYFVCGC